MSGAGLASKYPQSTTPPPFQWLAPPQANQEMGDVAPAPVPRPFRIPVMSPDPAGTDSVLIDVPVPAKTRVYAGGAVGVHLSTHMCRATASTSPENAHALVHDPRHVASVIDVIASAVGAVEPEPRLVVIGLPGNVDEVHGTVNAASNLGREWDGVVPLSTLVSERLQCPVELRNDTDTAMQGERRRGALVACNDGALVTLSTGVGVCILRNGVQFPAELGHSISQFDGPQCRGRAHRGCYETFLGGWALPDRYRERHPEFTGTHHTDIPDDEDFWNECGRRLGDLVLTLCYSGQRLEAVSFIGSVSLARQHRLLPAVHARVNEEIALLDVVPRSLRVTPLGEVTSVLGAFLMARDLLFPFLAA